MPMKPTDKGAHLPLFGVPTESISMSQSKNILFPSRVFLMNKRPCSQEIKWFFWHPLVFLLNQLQIYHEAKGQSHTFAFLVCHALNQWHELKDQNILFALFVVPTESKNKTILFLFYSIPPESATMKPNDKTMLFLL